MAARICCAQTLAFLALSFAADQDEESCRGYDETWALCPELPSCSDCVPVDCAFSDWGSWQDSEPSSGLLFRRRAIAQGHNECGQPCAGEKEESMPRAQHFFLVKQHCVLGQWGAWSRCPGGAGGQVYRSRGVQVPQAHGGEPCTGSTQETAPCGELQPPVPCLLSDWQEWTACSASCGEGRHTRLRHILSGASNGGEACEDNLLETRPCTAAAACGGSDCAMGAWSEWSLCDPEANPQRFRHRQVQRSAWGEGRRCNDALRETQACPRPKAEQCALSEWSEWSALDWRELDPPRCSRECGGGQAVRLRSILAPPRHGGSCAANSLQEVKACNTKPCLSPCALSDWSEWGACSATCGRGSRTRARGIANPTSWHASGCQGALEEAVPCLGKEAACPKTDCAWGSWAAWGACSASCGGGTRQRARAVAAPPLNGGLGCPALASRELGRCNNFGCGEGCVDGQWGAWAEWAACPVTCGGAVTLRSREVASRPSACGRPATGPRQEHRTCGAAPCSRNQDCVLAAWGEWSVCSSTCLGARERSRAVELFAEGKGRRCDEASLREASPCNPGPGEAPKAGCVVPGPEDCRLGAWGEWSLCTKPCGGGQRERRREVLAEPKNGGRACDADLVVTSPCNDQPCFLDDCRQCIWGEWSEWGACSGGCNGERYRHRSIVQMPNHCGQPCDMRSAKEVGNCSTDCNALFCAWTEWTTTGACDASCGHGQATRSRELAETPEPKGALFSLQHGAMCQGAQLDHVPCEAAKSCEPACIPEDCLFSDWSEWGQPAASGLCERSRAVAAEGNSCGKPCQGATAESWPCRENVATPSDCALAAWGEWTECVLNGDVGQRHRERTLAQEPSLDGQPCTAPLHEAATCSPFPSKSCVLADWGEWSTCGQSCGGGMQQRHRAIGQHAEHGGELCEDRLGEVRACNEQPCEAPVACAYSFWSEWSACGVEGQRFRQRAIAAHARGAGIACSGGLEETTPCAAGPVTDCAVSAWTAWGACDKTCGGGQARRQRQIESFPRHGGKACPLELEETSGCGTVPCAMEDCIVGDWAEWTACSASCGTGQRQRSRGLLQAAGPGGAGCNLPLAELARCDVAACESIDCAWGDWEAWAGCSKPCGGGQQLRQRRILRQPSPGGRACEAQEKQETRACSTQSCAACQDGLWDDWSAWSGCSRSCGGGTTYRRRQIAQMADECGKPLEGDSHEVVACNEGVPCRESADCLFADWGLWSDCSKPCHGTASRTRHIERLGSGLGAFCKGHLQELSPCNPSPGEGLGPCELAQAYPPVDCVLGAWSAWSNCTSGCGGSQSRSRQVIVAATHGGKPCQGALREAQQCGACKGPKPVDCAYGDWEDWGACARCDGERLRFRRILRHAAHGGKGCERADVEMTEACPGGRRCGSLFCSWADWQQWGSCSAKCGQGKRSRRRNLALTRRPVAAPEPAKELMALYSRLEAEAREPLLPQELLLAFGAGLCSFFTLLALGRAAAARPLRFEEGSARPLVGMLSA